MHESLTLREIVRLSELETVIKDGQHAFVEVGNAIMEIRESRLYRKDYSTFEGYCQGKWGWGVKRAQQLARAAQFWNQRKQLAEVNGQPVEMPQNERQARAMRLKEKGTAGRPQNLEYIGTENDKENKPMPARKVPGAPVEHTTPPPMPQVTIKTPCVPITVTDRINELVREAMRLENSGPIAFTDRPFRHFMSQLLGLQKLVQPNLPGWGEDFHKPPEPKAKPITALDIYAAYPLKVGKPVALKAIEKQMKTDSPEHLLERTKLFAQTRNGDLEFVPHPSTWFNQQRFNDDPATWKAKELAGNGHSSAFTLKTQLDAIETKIKRIRHRGVEGPFGIKLDDSDKPEYQSLVAKKRELVNKIATLT